MANPLATERTRLADGLGLQVDPETLDAAHTHTASAPTVAVAGLNW